MSENNKDASFAVNASRGPASIGAREQEVLKALIRTYLATGEPVASRVLAQQRDDGLSSASIRNVLADLEEAGYLFQPHTSAGRVPTLDALRLYVASLDRHSHLPMREEESLRRALEPSGDEQSMLSRACAALSQITHQLGVVAVVPWSDTGLREIRFFRLTDRRVLALLVTVDGQVRERVARVPEDYSQDELDTAGRYFSRHFAGYSLERIRKELLKRVAEERAAYDQLLKRVLVLYHCGLLEMRDAGRVYLEGTAHLVGILRHHERLSEIVAALAAKEKLLSLLTTLVHESHHGESEGEIHVRIGLEEADLPEISLVAASYCTADHTEGAIGVIGPTRMEYDRAISAVSRARDLFNRVLKDN
jgi:heat-inducible transcriptional repressor